MPPTPDISNTPIVATFDATSAHSETVLVVDDELIVQRAVRRIMERCGHVVLVACNGAEALRICESHEGPIRLMITDLAMPGMSGRELAPRVRALRPDIALMFMSGYSEDTAIGAVALERDAMFVSKPFTPQDLTNAVRELLGAAAQTASSPESR